MVWITLSKSAKWGPALPTNQPVAMLMISRALLLFAAAGSVVAPAPVAPARNSSVLKLALRRQVQSPSSTDFSWETSIEHADWKANETALILIDLWNCHPCDAMWHRTTDVAFRVNRTASSLRARGVHILHSPSDNALKFYAQSPARARVVAAPPTKPPRAVNLTNPAPLPLATPGLRQGCPDSLDSTDTTPGNTCHIYRQSSLIFIDEERDGVLDSNSGSEAHSYLKSVGVKHLLYVGVASNMCVMHREDATLNMVSWGWDVAVVRDEVDAMYSPQDSPYVSHEVANEIQASYFEQHVCPTVHSHQLDYLVAR
jgi:nicotinamidase-related amidase